MDYEIPSETGNEWEKVFRSQNTSLSDFCDNCSEQESGTWRGFAETEQRKKDGLVAEGTNELNSWGAFGAQLHLQKNTSSGKDFQQVLYEVSHLLAPQSPCSTDDVQSCCSALDSWTETRSDGEKGGFVDAPDRKEDNTDITYLTSGTVIANQQYTHAVQTSESTPMLTTSLPKLSQCQKSNDPAPGNSTSLALLHSSSKDSPYNSLTLKKMLTPIWKMIACHRFAGPFMKPVSETQAPGYKDVVKRPKDLTTIKRDLSKRKIRTPVEFQRDILLMLQNAVMYNSCDHHVYHKALEVQRDVVELMQVLNLHLDNRLSGVIKVP